MAEPTAAKIFKEADAAPPKLAAHFPSLPTHPLPNIFLFASDARQPQYGAVTAVAPRLTHAIQDEMALLVQEIAISPLETGCALYALSCKGYLMYEDASMPRPSMPEDDIYEAVSIKMRADEVLYVNHPLINNRTAALRLSEAIRTQYSSLSDLPLHIFGEGLTLYGLPRPSTSNSPPVTAPRTPRTPAPAAPSPSPRKKKIGLGVDSLLLPSDSNTPPSLEPNEMVLQMVEKMEEEKRVLSGGASLGSNGNSKGSGTLGGWMQVGEVIMALTNQHVTPTVGSLASSPSPLDRKFFIDSAQLQTKSCLEKEKRKRQRRKEELWNLPPVGPVVSSVLQYLCVTSPSASPSLQRFQRVDAALIRLDATTAFQPLNVPDLMTSTGVQYGSPQHNKAVAKYGRTSGRTTGTILPKLSGSIVWPQDAERRQCTEWTVIGSCGEFLRPGDSGSLVFEKEGGRVIGLGIGGEPRLSFFTDIVMAMNALEVAMGSPISFLDDFSS